MVKQNNKKGFTIIEVILVLAIGSLIILMALVALPSLQASQRDSQRKTDYSLLETAITNYMSNNRNQLPTDTTFISTYIKDTWEDPKTGAYTASIVAYSNSVTAPTEGQVKIVTGAQCNGEAVASGSAKQYAIWGYLESGVYCQSN